MGHHHPVPGVSVESRESEDALHHAIHHQSQQIIIILLAQETLHILVLHLYIRKDKSSHPSRPSTPNEPETEIRHHRPDWDHKRARQRDTTSELERAAVGRGAVVGRRVSGPEGRAVGDGRSDAKGKRERDVGQERDL